MHTDRTGLHLVVLPLLNERWTEQVIDRTERNTDEQLVTFLRLSTKSNVRDRALFFLRGKVRWGLGNVQKKFCIAKADVKKIKRMVRP